MSILVKKPGLLATIQDTGRYGYQQYGVIVSGAMDGYSLKIANHLVGNDEDEACIEISMLGTVLQFNQDSLIAITGGDLQAYINNNPAPLWRSLFVSKGSILKFKRPVVGCRAYVSIAGGFEVDPIMESKSTYLKAKIGGFSGRSLMANDEIQIGKLSEKQQHLLEKFKEQLPASWYVDYTDLVSFSREQTIQYMEGTEYAKFTEESRYLFDHSPFSITTQSDRMGYRMNGPHLKLTDKFDLLSEATTFGTVQVPSGGHPIILMADRQTTGGYPKIAQIITADLPSLAQMSPNNIVYFKKVTLEEAQQKLLKKEQILQKLKRTISEKLK
ncbi:5-oxoprolinase subunit C family protein [Rummeliibacillus sp. JY-2-4R]